MKLDATCTCNNSSLLNVHVRVHVHELVVLIKFCSKELDSTQHVLILV